MSVKEVHQKVEDLSGHRLNEAVAIHNIFSFTVSIFSIFITS